MCIETLATQPAKQTTTNDTDAWFAGGKKAAMQQALDLVQRTLAAVRGTAEAWAAHELASEEEIQGMRFACQRFAEVADKLASQAK